MTTPLDDPALSVPRLSHRTADEIHRTAHVAYMERIRQKIWLSNFELYNQALKSGDEYKVKITKKRLRQKIKRGW